MNGTDPAVSLGAVELTFRRTMIGYVDRLGGYRMVLWMLVGLAPLFLVSFIIGQTHAPKWVHLVVIPRCPQLPGSGLDRSRRVRHGERVANAATTHLAGHARAGGGARLKKKGHRRSPAGPF